MRMCGGNGPISPLRGVWLPLRGVLNSSFIHLVKRSRNRARRENPGDALMSSVGTSPGFEEARIVVAGDDITGTVPAPPRCQSTIWKPCRRGSASACGNRATDDSGVRLDAAGEENAEFWKFPLGAAQTGQKRPNPAIGRKSGLRPDFRLPVSVAFVQKRNWSVAERSVGCCTIQRILSTSVRIRDVDMKR